MNYLHWDTKTITDFSDEKITEIYNQGYVFTRLGKGVMHQTRSIRINLNKFHLSSENRRILNKNKEINLHVEELPLKSYDWSIAKLGKDFYETKFGPNIMSAQKIKELLTNSEVSNFTNLFVYSVNNVPFGYSIAYKNTSILHYSYPFYDLTKSSKDLGLGMMTLAIKYAQENNHKYIYLGSLQRPNDTYKLQYSGIEWFDGKEWQENISEVKKLLTA